MAMSTPARRWDGAYPASRQIVIEDVRIYITHIGGQPCALVRALPQPQPDVYIFGHTHVALLETLSGVLFLNPGAAGPSALWRWGFSGDPGNRSWAGRGADCAAGIICDM